MGDPRDDREAGEPIAEADTLDPVDEVEAVERPRESFWRQVLWFGLDVDPRKLGGSALSLAGGVAVGGAFAVLFLLGEGWDRMAMAEMLAAIGGVGAGVVLALDTLTRRPALLLAPVAHALGAVIAAVLALRLAGRLELARSVLAYSLAMHAALVPLLARLWGTLLWQRRLGGATARRAALLEAARSGDSDHLLIRVVEVDGGQVLAETIGDEGRELQIAASMLSPHPRPGLIYILPEALVINRAVPGDHGRGRWARHVVRADDSLLLGFKPEVAPAEVAQRLALQAALVLAALSVAATALALALALA